MFRQLRFNFEQLLPNFEQLQLMFEQLLPNFEQLQPMFEQLLPNFEQSRLHFEQLAPFHAFRTYLFLNKLISSGLIHVSLTQPSKS
ncbi:hypothetical protein ACLIA0_03785 [Bacillaceae bacterium W0354]